MRMKVVQRPPVASIDGLRLDRFEPGYHYDVGTALGILMLAERWAEPVLNKEPALLVPLNETKPCDNHDPLNLIRRKFPPCTEQFSVAADRERKTRTR